MPCYVGAVYRIAPLGCSLPGPAMAGRSRETRGAGWPLGMWVALASPVPFALMSLLNLIVPVALLSPARGGSSLRYLHPI